MPHSSFIPSQNIQVHPNLIPTINQPSSYITSYFHILTTQNNTLKSQNNFLKEQITKLYQNQRKILQKIKKLKNHIKILKYQNQIYQDRYEYLKKYVIQIGIDTNNKKNQTKSQLKLDDIKQNIKKIQNFNIFSNNLKNTHITNKFNTDRLNNKHITKTNNNINNRIKNLSIHHNQHQYQYKYQHSQQISPFYSDRIYQHNDQQNQPISYQYKQSQQYNIKTNKYNNNNNNENNNNNIKNNHINHTPLILQSPKKQSFIQIKDNKLTKNTHSLSMKLFQNIQNLSKNDQIYQQITQIPRKNTKNSNNISQAQQTSPQNNNIITKISQQISKLNNESQNLIQQYNKSGNNNKNIKKKIIQISKRIKQLQLKK